MVEVDPNPVELDETSSLTVRGDLRKRRSPQREAATYSHGGGLIASSASRAGRHHLQHPRLIPLLIQIIRRVPSGSDMTNRHPTPAEQVRLGADAIDRAPQSRDLSRTDLLALRRRTQPLLLAQLVILAVIQPGPTAPNQTALNAMPSQPELPRPYWTKLYSRFVGKLPASDDSIAALASSTSLSICRAYLPYLSKMVSEFRTAFLTLVSFENNTVPPSAG